MNIKEKIINDINDNKIMLFMKGTKEMPMCGFSATVVKILNFYDADFKAINDFIFLSMYFYVFFCLLCDPGFKVQNLNEHLLLDLN